jgi:uncharacterized Fe-S cluster protein YjdI
MKRRYGARVVFNAPSESVDFETGERNLSNTISIEIRNVIVLPELADRQFVERLSSIVANREFSYGTYFDSSVRRFIVDGRDLKEKDYEPKDNHFLVWNYRRYEITKIDRVNDEQGCVITGKEVKGNKVLMTMLRSPWNRLVMGQSVSQEVV